MIDPHDERSVRLGKVAKLRAAGIHPYPEKFDKRDTALFCSQAQDKTNLKTAGRLMSMREMGAIVFGHLQDDTGRIQLVFKEDILEKDNVKTLLDLVDMGDFLGVEGERFTTQKGEPSILVTQWTFLGKSLRPLPDKFHGLKDRETMYRQRYLDLVTNRETFDRFMVRSRFIKLLREFYWSHGFVEIESGTLGSTASGALAKPFVTHHDALDQDFYLRIAIETPQKEAIVGGFERTFEIGKVFRNEGMDPSHLQEFTACEHYAAWWNYQDNIRFTEDMLEFLTTGLFGTTKVQIPDAEGKLIEADFKPPYPVVSFRELLLQDAGIDINVDDTAEKLRAAIRAKDIVVEDMDKLGFGNLIDALYKKTSRRKIVNPTFLIGHPVELSPLARKNDDDPRIVDRFQLVAVGWELVNAYSELVDPVDQKERFEQQAAAQEGGDDEAHGKDDEYVKAMEYGMPPISGWGMGIDRIVALLTKQDNLRDVVLFPLVRPEDGTLSSFGKGGGLSRAIATDKTEDFKTPSQEIPPPRSARVLPFQKGEEYILPDETTKRFVAILSKKAETGRLMNALGQMAAGLVGGHGLDSEGTFLDYQDRDGSVHSPISHFPFIVLSADNSSQLSKVIEQAKELGIPYNFFTDTMTIGGSEPQREATRTKSAAELEYWGVCLFGEAETLKPLTKKFSLFR